MALIQTVHLSMANFKSAPVVPAVQNDTDRQVKMIIDDYTLTSGLTGKIAFERSDGTHYETAAELVLVDNAFVADIDQALTQPGRTMVQLKVTDTLTVSTFSFVIFVEADNSGTVTPQEGIDLVTAVASAEAAADRAESAAAEASGLSDQAKLALLACFEQVAWIGDDGQDYYDALEDALYPVTPPATLVSISAVYTQTGTVYDTDSLDSLKADLVVTAHYDDSTTAVISAGYTLSGTLTAGTSTITVSYGGKTTTFNVTVTQEWDISWDYTDGMPDETIFTKIDIGTTSSTLTDNGLEMSVKGTSTEFGYSYESSYSTGVIEAVFNFNAIEAYVWVTFGDGTDRIATRSQYSANYKGIYLCNAATISSMTKLQTTALNTDYKIKVVLDNGYGDIYINDTLAQSGVSTASILAGGTKVPVFKVNGNDSNKTGTITLKSIKIKLGRTA